MSDSINLYASYNGVAGFDFRLFFPGATVNTLDNLSYALDNSNGTAEYSVAGNKKYDLTFLGSNFVQDSNGNISGLASSGKVVAGDGSQKTLATMEISSGSVAVASILTVTPDSLINNRPDLELDEFGNVGNDRLWGSDYGDYLFGYDGHDTLTGNGGKDQFVLDRSAYDSYDYITDFAHGSDKLVLDRFDDATQFKGITNANLLNTFHDITHAGEQADDRLLYNRDTGKVYYDADGAGGRAAVPVAVLSNHAAINFHDVKVF